MPSSFSSWVKQKWTSLLKEKLKGQISAHFKFHTVKREKAGAKEAGVGVGKQAQNASDFFFQRIPDVTGVIWLRVSLCWNNLWTGIFLQGIHGVHKWKKLFVCCPRSTIGTNWYASFWRFVKTCMILPNLGIPKRTSSSGEWLLCCLWKGHVVLEQTVVQPQCKLC